MTSKHLTLTYISVSDNLNIYFHLGSSKFDNTTTNKYIYICVCVCVCVCIGPTYS